MQYNASRCDCRETVWAARLCIDIALPRWPVIACNGSSTQNQHQTSPATSNITKVQRVEYQNKQYFNPRRSSAGNNVVTGEPHSPDCFGGIECWVSIGLSAMFVVNIQTITNSKSSQLRSFYWIENENYFSKTKSATPPLSQKSTVNTVSSMLEF